MKVKIVQSFCSKGSRQGIPCVNVFMDEKGKEMSTNEIVSELLEYRGRGYVYGIVAKLTQDQEMVQLIRVLAEGGLKMVVYTDTSDDISTLAHMRSINFSLSFLMPKGEDSGMNHNTLNCLREGDEVAVATEDKVELDYAIKALKAKLFTRPDIVFLVPEEMNNTIMKNKFTCTVRVIN